MVGAVRLPPTVINGLITFPVSMAREGGGMLETGKAPVAAMGRRAGRSTTDELLAEALVLAESLRSTHQLMSVLSLEPLARLEVAAKQGELTALIGFAVAWLYGRKAVENGELDSETARSEAWRLGQMAPVALDAGAAGPLGRRLAELDRAVRALHDRLARLDRLLDARQGGS